MALSDQTKFSGDAQIDQHHIAQVSEQSAKYLVRASLKQSDVGLIPIDWSLKGLAEIAELDAGLSKPKIIFGKGCPVVTVQDLYAGSIIDTAALKRVSVTADEIKKYRLTKNDILIGNASVKRDGIGYANRFDGASEDVIFAKYAYRARTFDSVLPLYLHHVLRADFCRQWIVANSQTGTLTNLNKSAAKAIPITVPPTIDEQRTIATALSDVDALIAGLERLIAKKRGIKQATMQQLLTGQTRLPGFSGEWTPRPLGDLGTTYGGLVGKSKVDFGHGSARYVPFVNVMANIRIDCSALERVHVTPTENQSLVLHGDLLFNGSSETPEEVALCALMTEAVEDLYLNSFCFGFRLKRDADANGLFLTYLMRSQLGRELMKSLAQGSTRYNLSKSALLQASLNLPDLEEQSAIATVLSDMDADLAALEARLTKTRAIKQGMMQELLTGRTRLL